MIEVSAVQAFQGSGDVRTLTVRTVRHGVTRFGINTDLAVRFVGECAALPDGQVISRDGRRLPL